MTDKMEGNLNKNNPLERELLFFITEARNGKLTSQIPVLSNVEFRRMVIQEQDESLPSDLSDEPILYGISY